MKTKNLVLSAVLLGLGTLLHFITPPIIMGVKPDFLLVMAFIGIFIARDLKSTLVISLASGFIAALTTSFPMGQLPNILDKFVAGFLVYFIFKALNFELKPMTLAIISAFGTLVSGLIFLSSALFLIGQLNMFMESLPVVLVTIPINALAAALLYKTFNMSLKLKAY